MKKIYKHRLKGLEEELIILPKGAEILSVNNQFEHLVIWVLFDTNERDDELRKIVTYRTGQEITDSENLNFIDTVLFDQGNLVIHIFEKTKL